jgi:hypothetical protein
MSGLSPQAQALLAKFSQEPGVTPDQMANLQSTINSSPPLVDQLNAAVAAGHLKGFEPLPAGTHAGGEYHPGTQTIRLPPAMLTTPPGRSFDMAEPAFVLGHELQHGFNRIETKKANDTLLKELEAEARTPAAVHDYTAAIEKRLTQNRRDEAGAEIAGWNALVGQVMTAHPNAGLADIYKASPRAADFIDLTPGNPSTYSIKPNLTLNADMSLSQTPNVEGMGQNYFDKPAKAAGLGLGYQGTSDYQNYYGASAISMAVQVDSIHAKPYQGQTPQMHIDMNRLGLSEKLLEENGLFIGRGSPAPKEYYDTSQTPYAKHHFDHTHQTHTYSPVAPSASRTPDDPAHPDHVMLQQIRGHVSELERSQGREYSDTSERISRCLLVACMDQRDMYPHTRNEPLAGRDLTRVDHVVLGTNSKNIFAVEGRLDDPAHRRSAVNVEQAMRTPVEQSDQKLEAANQQISQEQTQVQLIAQQQDVQGPDVPGRGHRT